MRVPAQVTFPLRHETLGRHAHPAELARADDGWQIRGMAVAEDRRGTGLGTQVLSALVEHVAFSGGGLVWCRARTRAVSLYERNGFMVHGRPVEDEVAGAQVLMARLIADDDL